MPIAPPPTTDELQAHRVVSRDKWLSAREELLKQEKEVTRLNDRLSEQRRALPWVKVEKEYVFDAPDGKQTLAELFDGRSQLIVYHFMFGPDSEEGCDGCSFLSDHFDGANRHLPHHDVTLLAVSRAPLATLLPFKKRMDWRFKWVSSSGSDFNEDFGATSNDTGDEHHGISVFYRPPTGSVFHTYSAYARGVDFLCGTHNLLDLTPKGRNENSTMDWVRLNDQYDAAPARSSDPR